ncbi:MAG: DUF5689 domain-containing protein [Flavobacteriales bacterium]
MSIRQHIPMNLRNVVSALALMVVAVACKKEFDSPPVRTLPVGEIMTVAQLRSLAVPGEVRHFGGDSSVYAVVTADEENGNLYKNIYVQDHTGAIIMRLLNSGGLYQGDSIRIYLPGTILSYYRGMLQLDSVDVDNNVVKQATQVHKEPMDVTIAEITPAIQGMLVRLHDVEFALSELGNTYADAVNQATVNRMLSDCQNEVIVRNSGYANFAGQQLPTGNGSFVAVVGQFDDDMQLFIRDLNEVRLDSPDRCDPLPTLCDPVNSVQENFATVVSNVDITNLACWNNAPQVGTRRWRGYSVSGDLCAQATSFQSGSADITWLISPPVNYSPGMNLSFRTQRGFGVANHDPFALFISTDYNITNLATANWTPVPCAYATPSTADQVWVASGSIDLASSLPSGYTGSFVIGFRYSGNSSSQTTNFRVDDVQIN